MKGLKNYQFISLQFYQKLVENVAAVIAKEESNEKERRNFSKESLIFIFTLMEEKKKKRYGRIRDREMKRIIMMRIGREKYVKRKTEIQRLIVYCKQIVKIQWLTVVRFFFIFF